ncbi:alpha/beta-hydrolase [Lentinula lateritia]|uniref:Alpha/beta-hydrolase n=1 Tax=Lentinula lateritia TaxID=40482 RepID=A0ABQ8VE99_9AGAR|nr:alpha/beta-hydrolase [Lentinula lateritia]
MSFFFRTQPLKAVYMICFVLSVLGRIPLWAITAAIPALRPRNAWSYHRTLIFHAINAFMSTFFQVGFMYSTGEDPEAVAASSTASEVGFVWVEPLEETEVVGEVAEAAEVNNVKAVKTAGYWYPPSMEPNGQHPAADEQVILHIHGGGHVMGSAHPHGGPAGPVCSGLLEHCAQIKRVFSCGYRLASSAPYPSKNPFPAGLLDVISGYKYLIKLGFKPQNIIICGDSAGGNLAMALTLYATLNKLPSLPIPGGLVLISASVEWEITHNGPESSWKTNACSDFSNLFFTKGYTARSLLGNLAPATIATSPWISPASLKLDHSVVEKLFVGFPMTYIIAGGAETARDALITLRDHLQEGVGRDKVIYNEVKDATHDIVTMDWYEPERSEIFKDIALWINKVYS